MTTPATKVEKPNIPHGENQEGIENHKEQQGITKRQQSTTTMFLINIISSISVFNYQDGSILWRCLCKTRRNSYILHRCNVS